MSRTKCEYSQNTIFVLGGKIKESRKNKGLTLKELGDRVNLTHSALSKIENNKNDVSKKTLIALAQELNNNFGQSWLDEYLLKNNSVPSKKEIAEKMSVKEFVGLKFGGKSSRRSQKEIDALTTMLDAEIERIKEEEEKYGRGNNHR